MQIFQEFKSNIIAKMFIALLEIFIQSCVFEVYINTFNIFNPRLRSTKCLVLLLLLYYIIFIITGITSYSVINR